MSKRINAMLPDTTARDHKNLRERLKQEALANAERDLEMAVEWFPLEEQAWQIAERVRKKRK